MNIQNKHVGQPLRRFIAWKLLFVFLATSFPLSAIASTWEPTLLVNTESFQVIDDGSGSSNIELRFGDTANEIIRWDVTNARFQFTDDVHIEGNITGSGTAIITGNLSTKADFTLNSDSGAADAVLTFGSDTTNETLTFDNTQDRFEFSDDQQTQGDLSVTGHISGATLQTTGNANIFGTLSASGTLKTDGDLTLNDDQTNANTVLTFGSDSTNETLTFLNAADRFEFSDDVHTTGGLTASGTFKVTGAATFGSTVRINGVTYTFPSSDGTSGYSLTTNGAGTLSWSDATGVTQTNGDNRYVNASGDTMTGALTVNKLSGTSTGNTLIVDTKGLVYDATNKRVGVGTASPRTALEVLGTISGSMLNIRDAVTASGALSIGGAGTIKGDLTINSDQTAANTVLTFGSDSTNETLTFLNTADRFEFSDDAHATGNLTASGTFTVTGAANFGSTVKLNGVTYTFPGSEPGSGYVLKTNGAGTLQWAKDAGPGSGDILFLQPEYPHAIYFASGSSMVGQLSMSGSVYDKENYYLWKTTSSSLQDYWVSIRTRVPDTFTRWDPVKPVEFRYRTKSGTNSVNHLTVKVFDTAGTAVTMGTGALVSEAWRTFPITGPSSSQTWTPGSYFTTLVKIATTTSGWAAASFLEYNWETTAP